MGLFGWLFGRREGDGAPWLLDDGDAFSHDIVGEASYQDALARLAGPKTEDGADHECEAVLRLDDANKHDRNAVAVTIGGRTVGYLSRKDAKTYRERIGRDARCNALITGGWKRAGATRGISASAWTSRGRRGFPAAELSTGTAADRRRSPTISPCPL